MAEQKKCVLDEYKICDECGNCNRCDLDPNKICDNCMKCVRTDAEYNAVEIDEIFEAESLPKEYVGYESSVYSREKPENPAGE